MIITTAILFLFGAAVAAENPTLSNPTEIIIEKHVIPSDNLEMGYMPSSGHSPFISNFIQKGTNIFFKPQFMLSSSQLPPQIQNVIAAIEKNCKVPIPMMSSLSNIDEPLRVIEKEVNNSPIKKIKEVIEIKPAKVAVNTHEIWEADVATRKPVEIIEHVKIPKAPVLLPYVPDIVAAPSPIPAFIPSPPELPLFTPPKFLERPEVSSKQPERSESKNLFLVEVEEPKEITKSIVIPPAPKLPHLDLPSLPIIVEKPSLAPHLNVVEFEKHIEIPSAPILNLPEKPEVLITPPNPILIEESKPAFIPQPPTLPPFSLPQLPARVVIEESSAHITPSVPCENYETVELDQPKEEPKIVLPGPVLPPFEIKKMPVVVEKLQHVPEFPGAKPVIVELDESHHPTPLVIPPAPILSPFKIPKLPVVIEKRPVSAPIVIESEKHIEIPLAPELPSFELPQFPSPIIVEEIKPVSIPQPPVLPPFKLPQLPARVVVEESRAHNSPAVPVPCEPSSTIEINTKPLPDAPILPPFLPMQLPAPVVIEEHISEKAEVKPLVIPSAPVLRPFKIPEVSVSLKESEKEPPCPQNTVLIEPRPVLLPFPVTIQELSKRPVEMLSIPTTPMFPEWLLPYIPQINLKEEKNASENITSSLTSCIHDIVVDRILSKNSLEHFSTSSRAPVSFTYLAPVPIRMVK